MVVSLLIAEARYGISFIVSPAVVPAILLVAFTGTMIGYGLAPMAGLTQGLVTGLARSYLILVAWTVAGWAVAAWVVGRRK